MTRQTHRSGTFQGANLEHARALNRRAVFDAVRRHGPVTRAELARLIGLTVQGVSNVRGHDAQKQFEIVSDFLAGQFASPRQPRIC